MVTTAITVAEPHNDLVKSRGMLSAFRQEVRKVLDRIKAQHGHTTPLHVLTHGSRHIPRANRLRKLRRWPSFRL